MPLPVRVAQHHHRIGPRRHALARMEQPPQIRLDAHHFEIVPGHIIRKRPIRLVALYAQPIQPIGVSHHSAEHLARLAVQRLVLHQRKLRLPRRPLLPRPNLQHPAFLPDMHRAEHQPVHHAENRRVHADPQRQRYDRDRRKSRALPQLPQRIAHIAPQVFHRNKTVHLPDLLTNHRWIPQLHIRPPSSLLRRHSPRDVVRGLLGQMRVQLSLPLLVPLPSSQIPAQTHRLFLSRHPAEECMFRGSRLHSLRKKKHRKRQVPHVSILRHGIPLPSKTPKPSKRQVHPTALAAALRPIPSLQIPAQTHRLTLSRLSRHPAEKCIS